MSKNLLRSFIPENHIGTPYLRQNRELGVQNGLRQGIVVSVAGFEANQLSLTRSGDQKGALVSKVESAFEEERNVRDEHGRHVTGSSFSLQLKTFLPDPGMKDSLKRLAGAAIIEDQLAESPTMQFSVLPISDLRSERRDYF